jgi:transposase
MSNPVEAALSGDWDAVKQFLLDNEHLSIYEIAIKVNKSPSTIRNWRRKTGLSKKYPFKTRPTPKKADLPTIEDQEIWDNEEWFREQYETERRGIQAIAKIIKRSPRLVALRLQKYDIETRSHSQAVRSSNPCSDKKWLMHHYATKEEYAKWASEVGIDEDGGLSWSLKKCSGIAGVVPATIYNWLVRINNEGCSINIRDLNESVAGERNPFFGKKHSPETIEKLKKIYHEKHGNTDARPKAGSEDPEEEQPG